MATTQTTVLISGANRGLGKELLRLYLLKPFHTVIAANRDPTHPTSTSLTSLPAAPGSRLIIIKIDSASETDASEAIQELTTRHGINHLDVVIANAGISYIWPKVSELVIADLKRHMEVNVEGVVRLFQASLGMLGKSMDAKWITMGSSAGWLETYTCESSKKTNVPLKSINSAISPQPQIPQHDPLNIPKLTKNPHRNQLPIPNAAYATSKAAIHWLTKKMNQEEPGLTAFVLDPGWCQTDLGNAGAVFFGMEKAAVGVEESCMGMVKLIEKATKEGYGGRLWGYQGEVQRW